MKHMLLLFALGSISLAADLPAPEWSHQAIWYQVFVERFWNGDTYNDPTLSSAENAWPHNKPPEWRVTPWNSDWYRPDPWVRPEDGDFYRWVHHRRYGGDLQGLLDRLDELQDLGITALYLNPINDAPSLHKYDARNWRHVDVNFGPDPAGDMALMASENPADPATWVFTSADRLFLDLVREAHAKGMRVVLDYSWNHTGLAFWAFQDVVKKQAESPYSDWYEISAFDDPATQENEFQYEGWAGIRELPAVKQFGVPEGQRGGLCEGTLHPEVSAHIFAVTQRWLDPDGDGDCSDGIDGYRLDVAEQVPLGFWKEYRSFVKSINEDALLVGEIWWEHWPHTMMDPLPWLEAFDSVMHYQWYMPVRSYLAGTMPWFTAKGLMSHLDDQLQRLPVNRRLALMNLVASHDTPRFATSIANRGRYKFQVNPRENPACHLDPPTEKDLAVMRMIRVLQFTWPGAPHIWNGDEFGMWGADDPDNRKPLLWPDTGRSRESWRPFGDGRDTGVVPPRIEVANMRVRTELKQLIALRKAEAELWSAGEIKWLFNNDNSVQGNPAITLHSLVSSWRPPGDPTLGLPKPPQEGLLAYERSWGEKSAVILFNTGPMAMAVQTGPRSTIASEVHLMFRDPDRRWRRVVDTSIEGFLPPESSQDESCSLLPQTAQVWMAD